MSEMTGLFNLGNFGHQRNCSLTTLLFPANFKVIDMQMGLDDVKDKEVIVLLYKLYGYGSAIGFRSMCLFVKAFRNS